MEYAPKGRLPNLPAGTQVGPWLLMALHGQGAYGAVYRAVRVGQEHSGHVALKLALYPWGQRFVREAQLLSRLSHPGIPRLLDSGVLRFPGDALHPWFVMEWVEGTPLYEWAQQHALSSRQVCLFSHRAPALRSFLEARVLLSGAHFHWRPQAAPAAGQSRCEGPLPAAQAGHPQRAVLGGAALDDRRGVCGERLYALQG